MVVLDATITNIALPNIGKGLHIDRAAEHRQGPAH
jgi:hypothetical protein